MKKEVEKISNDVMELQKICKELKKDFGELREILQDQFKKDDEELELSKQELDFKIPFVNNLK